MKRLVFYFLIALGFVGAGAGCSEEDPWKGVVPGVLYEKTDLHITSLEAELYAATGEYSEERLNKFYLVAAFDETDECRLTEETYATIIYTDGGLHFFGKYVEPDGRLHWTAEENLLLRRSVPWADTATESDYDYYQMFPLRAIGEGEYRFALEFYQPSSQQYFVTRMYRLQLWLEEGHFRSKISLVR